jgi:peptidyl-prolyl cis-trans isomerase C
MTLAHDFVAAPTQSRRRRARAEERAPETGWRRAARAVAPLLRHRLFQFGVIGGLLFAVAPRARSPQTIEITSDRLAALHAAEAARAGGMALPTEKAHDVDQRALEDEILYREGVRLGLDRNDGIVRQRVTQKVLFLAEEMAGASRPADEASLRAFFEQNRERWALPQQHRFAQIYRHGRDALAAWAAGPRTGEPPAGEPSPVGAEIDGDRDRIAASLGAGFADAVVHLDAAPPGSWSGPLQSAFGWHLVRVVEHRPARPARLEEVRSAVVEAYGVFRRQEATADFLTRAFARYQVTLDGERLQHFTPTRRIAFRGVSSGED